MHVWSAANQPGKGLPPSYTLVKWALTILETVNYKKNKKPLANVEAYVCLNLHADEAHCDAY